MAIGVIFGQFSSASVVLGKVKFVDVSPTSARWDDQALKQKLVLPCHELLHPSS